MSVLANCTTASECSFPFACQVKPPNMILWPRWIIVSPKLIYHYAFMDVIFGISRYHAIFVTCFCKDNSFLLIWSSDLIWPVLFGGSILSVEKGKRSNSCLKIIRRCLNSLKQIHGQPRNQCFMEAFLFSGLYVEFCPAQQHRDWSSRLKMVMKDVLGFVYVLLLLA